MAAMACVWLPKVTLVEAFAAVGDAAVLVTRGVPTRVADDIFDNIVDKGDLIPVTMTIKLPLSSIEIQYCYIGRRWTKFIPEKK